MMPASSLREDRLRLSNWFVLARQIEWIGTIHTKKHMTKEHSCPNVATN